HFLSRPRFHWSNPPKVEGLPCRSRISPRVLPLRIASAAVSGYERQRLLPCPSSGGRLPRKYSLPQAILVQRTGHLSMRLSRYFLPVLRETPKEAEIISHQLMLRAGMIRQASAGIYSWLPLGFKVL